MIITYLGHSCVHIKTANHQIIIDPFISGNPLMKDFDLNSIEADYIFLTHAHQDHILDAEFLAKKNNAIIVSSYEVCNHYSAKGLETQYLNVGAQFAFDFGKVRGVAAIHSSSFSDGSYGGLAQGFVFTIEDKKIYHSGDTALTYEMKILPKLFKSIDLALLPLGNVYTMDYKEAARAAKWCKASKTLGLHYDTFPPLEIDKTKAVNYFNSKGKELILLNPTESLEL